MNNQHLLKMNKSNSNRHDIISLVFFHFPCCRKQKCNGSNIPEEQRVIVRFSKINIFKILLTKNFCAHKESQYEIMNPGRNLNSSFIFI